MNQGIRLSAGFGLRDVFPYVLGEDGHGPSHTLQKRSIALFQKEGDLMWVRWLGPFHVVRDHPATGVPLEVGHCEDNMVGGHRSSIESVGIGHHFENKSTSSPVIAPRRCQRGHDAVFVVPHQGIENQPHANITCSSGIVLLWVRIAPVSFAICNSHLGFLFFSRGSQRQDDQEG